MLGPRKERRGERLVPISLEAAVPADHFYRHLEAVLDLGFVREWVAERYAEGGRPGIDPVVFFKLQLVMFFPRKPRPGACQAAGAGVRVTV